MFLEGSKVRVELRMWRTKALKSRQKPRSLSSPKAENFFFNFGELGGFWGRFEVFFVLSKVLGVFRTRGTNGF